MADMQSLLGGFDNMTQDPGFITGLGLMGAGQPNNPALLRAYQTLQGQREFTEKQKLDQARIAQEAAQTGVAQQQVGLLGQEVQQRTAQTQLLQEQLKRQQAQWEMGMKFLQQLRPDLAGAVQPPVQVQPAPNAPPVTVPGPPNIPVATQAASWQVRHSEPDSRQPAQDGIKWQPYGRWSAYCWQQRAWSRRIPISAFDHRHAQERRHYVQPVQPASNLATLPITYLQKELQANGGDWNKAIAAYGGFKSKDPTAYIQKVTAGFSGSPEAQAAASVQRLLLRKRKSINCPRSLRPLVATNKPLA
jgi:hypothetical protein